MPNRLRPRISKWARTHSLPLVVVGGIASIGLVLLTTSKAAGPFVATEPEQGTIAAPANLANDAAASGGKAVKFAPAGAFQANCIVKPSDCGYPDATNTGVPPGTQLTNATGIIRVTTDGAVIQNLNITDGSIMVRANNVTIKNVRITTCDYYPIDYYGGHTGLTVQDTEIHGTCDEVTACLSFNHYTAIRIHCHGGSDGFKADADATVQDSYIHDLAVTETSHNDGVQSTGGDNVTLRHNTFDVKDAGVCIQLGNVNRNWQILNNLFSCTGWQINGGNDTDNAVITGNRFTRIYDQYGTHSIDGAGITWTGNYYDDNGATIPF